MYKVQTSMKCNKLKYRTYFLDPSICFQKEFFKHKRLKQVKSKRMKKHTLCKHEPKKKQSSYINFEQSRIKNKDIIRNKKEHYAMIRGLILQEDINIHVANKRASQYIKEKQASQ